MAEYCLESSALAKFYHTEEGTPEITRLIEESNSRHYISRLSVIEMQSVFSNKVRTGVITEDDVVVLRQQFLRDIADNRFLIILMLESHYREAERLLRIHGIERGLRTLDSLQLAVGLDLYRRAMLDHFVSSDSILSACAIEEGLSIINPARP